MNEGRVSERVSERASECLGWASQRVYPGRMKSPGWRIVLGEEPGRFMNENFLTHENVEV